MVDEFDLNKKTGVDLPHELVSWTPSREFKARFNPRDAEWKDIDTVYASFGQVYDFVTPLAMLRAQVAIANGGRLYVPHLLREAKPVSAVGPFAERPSQSFDRPDPKMLNIPSDQHDLVVEGMWAVVNEPGGTGGAARIEGFDVAGKTGTAQVVGLGKDVGKNKDHSWFVSYAPGAQARAGHDRAHRERRLRRQVRRPGRPQGLRHLPRPGAPRPRPAPHDRGGGEEGRAGHEPPIRAGGHRPAASTRRATTEPMVAILEKRKLRDFDWLLTLLALAIALFGTWMIYNAQPDAGYWKKQIIGLGVSTVVMLGVAFTDYRKLVHFAPAFYAFGLFLLVIVLIPGIGLKINGQRAGSASPASASSSPRSS